jgi:hypothetical protein
MTDLTEAAYLNLQPYKIPAKFYKKNQDIESNCTSFSFFAA